MSLYGELEGYEYETLTVLVDGDLDRRTEVRECSRCGAIVRNTARHDARCPQAPDLEDPFA